MAYLRISEARAAGVSARSYISKSASQILTEDSRRFSSTDRYDVFLSHSYQDTDAIYGIKHIIEKLGLKVYVDWIDDSGLDRGPILPFVLEQGLALPGFIKELRYLAAFQNPQQAMYILRETVLRNSLVKQNQQAVGALAFGGLVILASMGISKGS